MEIAAAGQHDVSPDPGGAGDRKINCAGYQGADFASGAALALCEASTGKTHRAGILLLIGWL